MLDAQMVDDAALGGELVQATPNRLGVADHGRVYEAALDDGGSRSVHSGSSPVVRNGPLPGSARASGLGRRPSRVGGSTMVQRT